MLRYAGGKTRAIKQLLPLIPRTEIVSPFLGGGSLELVLAKTARVYAGDILAALVDFWNVMKTDRQSLIARLRTLHPFTKELYAECKSTLNDSPTPLDRAVKFFIINRCCYSGCMTGGYTNARSPIRCIDKLETIDLTNITIRNCDYETLLTDHPTTFAFLDPPYDVPNLYLSTPFDHERLAQILHARQTDWLLCYNDTPRIRRLYADCTITPISWAYGMNQTRTSNEILIRPARTEPQYPDPPPET